MSASTLADFEFLGRLGKGSFGEVHKVRRYADGNLYVCKLINVCDLAADEQEAAVREVHILAALDSPYVVRYFDSFFDDGQLAIIMELCDRGDLSRAIKRQVAAGVALPEERVWIIFLQIIMGVAYLHHRRTLHRDLKSANVFLCASDKVKIGDLGVARVLGTESFYARTCVGTPYYLSPELIEGLPYNDKSDMWAVGCILYELCTGRHAFDAKNQGTLIMKIIQGTYPPIPDTYSELLTTLVDALLTRDSNARPSALEVVLDPDIYSKVQELRLEIPEFIQAAWKRHHGSDAAATATPTPALRSPSPVPEAAASNAADAAALSVYDRHAGSLPRRSEAHAEDGAAAVASSVSTDGVRHVATGHVAPVQLTATVRYAPQPVTSGRASSQAVASPAVAVAGARTPHVPAGVAVAASAVVDVAARPRGGVRGTRFRRGDPTAGMRKRFPLPLSAQAAAASAAAEQRRRAPSATGGARSARDGAHSAAASPTPKEARVVDARLPAAAAPPLDATVLRSSSTAASRAAAREVAALPDVQPSHAQHAIHSSTGAAGAAPSAASQPLTTSSVASRTASRHGSRPSLDMLKHVSAPASTTSAQTNGITEHSAASGADDDDEYQPDFEPEVPAVGPAKATGRASAEPVDPRSRTASVEARTTSNASSSAADHNSSPPRPTDAQHPGHVHDPEEDVVTDLDLRRIANSLRAQRDIALQQVQELSDRCSELVPPDLIDAVLSGGGAAVLDVSSLPPDAYMCMYRLEYALGRLRDLDAQLLPFSSWASEGADGGVDDEAA